MLRVAVEDVHSYLSRNVSRILIPKPWVSLSEVPNIIDSWRIILILRLPKNLEPFLIIFILKDDRPSSYIVKSAELRYWLTLLIE